MEKGKDMSILSQEDKNGKGKASVPGGRQYSSKNTEVTERDKAFFRKVK